MNMMDIFIDILLSAAIILVVAGIVYLTHRRLVSAFAEKPDQQFRRQMITVSLVLFAILVIILLLPISNDTRGPLLSLFGIVLSATIALSSTSLVGNIMAGIMLRTVGAFRLGDYIRVGEYFGRVSEMDLLHTEIQTEERDLTTLPNTYLATNPVRVMRSSGTILSVELSLGYDVSRHTIEKLLLEAGNQCELESPFVQIRHLGDYSVTYAIAGLLTDVKNVIAKRRQLRAATMDVLHRGGIEIASPVIATTRAFHPEHQFIADGDDGDSQSDEKREGVSPDTLVFDKAIQAESLEKLKERQKQLRSRLSEIKATEADEELLAGEQKSTQEKLERLNTIIERRENAIKDE
ncbi:MAG: mechanosensitive ion channel family protein [Pseudomonadota bacterium]